jgi:peptidyl-prolyl cis-trans isomerase B (cyclophilin B)
MQRLIATLFVFLVTTSAFAADPVLSPVKTWYSPQQPVEIKVAAEGDVKLMATDFLGVPVDAKGETAVSGAKTVDIKTLFPTMAGSGTYLLYAVPKDKELSAFVGTPLVISVRGDRRAGAPDGPMVTKVEPLKFAVMTTAKGPLTMAFYYDVAPNTVHNFLTLSAEGYYSGLNFHRIVPSFVIQGGDPRGDGTGGPGYQIDAEFNERRHDAGVLSMARSQDPNSAGSQFFVCLDYNQTRALDRKYTAFGKVVAGMEAVDAIAKVARNPENDRPTENQSIEKVEVKNVTAAENPYVGLQKDLAVKTAP